MLAEISSIENFRVCRLRRTLPGVDQRHLENSRGPIGKRLGLGRRKQSNADLELL